MYMHSVKIILAQKPDVMKSSQVVSQLDLAVHSRWIQVKLFYFIGLLVIFYKRMCVYVHSAYVA
jgi:hypothetical protein